MPPSVLLINGPNLNLLGTREPHIYGSETLSDVHAAAHARAASLGLSLQTFQSNHEGAIIDRIHTARYGPLVDYTSSSSSSAPRTSSPAAPEELEEQQPFQPVDFIIINPGGLTHTSVALRDALAGAAVPFVEVHVSNVHAREEFRHRSFLSDKAVAVICGLGTFGYSAALEFVGRRLGTY